MTTTSAPSPSMLVMSKEEHFAGEQISPQGSSAEAYSYLHGGKFWAVTFAMGLIFLLVTMEVSIATTALVAITNELGGFNRASWLLSSYQLGYVGVIIIFSKFSDIFGRKLVLCMSILIFMIFSGACGASQTIVQLIVLRALQGVGGGGCFALSAIVLIELVPPEKYAKFVSHMNISIALAFILGPILGGVISSHTTWRWVFLLNVPAAAVALLLILLGMPKTFPYGQSTSGTRAHTLRHLCQKGDFPGSILLLLSTLSLAAAFQEAGSQLPWNSPVVISLLVISVLLYAVLLLWEKRVTKKDAVREPVLPWNFFTDRTSMGIFLGFILVGGPMTVTVFQLPQRFEIINGLSPFDAGVRLIPYGAAFPVGCVLSANLASKFQIPAMFLVISGAALQIIGFALLSTTPSSSLIPPRTYGFEVLSGLGTGASYQCLYLMIPFVVAPRDKAVAMGAANQLRMMGGAIFLAIATTIFNSYTMPRLEGMGILNSSFSADMAQTLAAMSNDKQQQVKSIISEGYNYQMLVLVALAAVQVPAATLTWRKKQIRLP